MLSAVFSGKMPMKPAVDLQHLSRYTGGDETLNAEVLNLFDNQITEMVGKLQFILDSQDAKGWKDITHTLKGAARGIGAFDFANAAAAAEPIDPIRDRGNASLAVRTLAASSADVQTFIRSYLKR